MAIVGVDSARGKQAAFVLRAWRWWQRAFLSRFGAPPWFRPPILWFAVSRTGWERELSDAGRGYASAYLKEIRELQPEGPYYLGGFCMGGSIGSKWPNN